MRTNELASMKQQVQELRSKVRTFIKLFFLFKIRVKLVFRLGRNARFLFCERETCNEIKVAFSLLNCFSPDKYERTVEVMVDRIVLLPEKFLWPFENKENIRIVT